MLKLLTQSDVTKAIITLRTDAASIQERIHLIACSTLDHVRAHGDTRGACDLLNALPKGQRVKALAHWFKHFSTNKAVFLFDKQEQTWTCKLSKDRKDSDFNVEAAMALNFAELTVEKEPVSITVESLLKNLARNSTNAEMHDGTEVPKVDPAARAFAAKLLAYAKSPEFSKAA